MSTRTRADAAARRAARPAKTNRIGLEKTSYRGRPSTLCKGCGHDSISQRIVNAAWEMGLDQTQVVKLSGIGCSSKTPAYYLGWSHGFNSLHGRMPSVATGAIIANASLEVIGVSGDGDTASIGIGQFKHAVRRNLPLIYIVENNGVYGLTKGQFSATADEGQFLKYQGVNDLPPLDICMEALTANATFVARSFAGDPKQLEALLKAAINHRGIAVLDIISPCVTFNNHDTSTKSYGFGRANEIRLHDLNFVPEFEEIEIEDYEDELEVELHDGGSIVLKKIDPEHDPKDRAAAYNVIQRSLDEQKLITGLLYINEEEPTLTELLNLTDTPLTQLPDEKLRPSREALEGVMATLA
ncbi:MAG: 2-oxoacid:ferredoxin oxidoreductase subunit beta [Caldilineaceae bacterium]|nr:2-oxoacid:ferredoxin oxidoreductase subunit beta [Caldilineaceae bacterium]